MQPRSSESASLLFIGGYGMATCPARGAEILRVHELTGLPMEMLLKG
jgi:hypothetical protein